jgi:hypothetical protein
MADGWLPSMPYAPPQVAREKLKAIREAADGAGRDPDALTYAYNVSVRVGGDPGSDPDRLVAGEPGAVTERLAGFVADGFGSPRTAVLLVLLFFVVGLILLSRVDIARGIREVQARA